MQEIISHLNSCGFSISEFIPDGSLHRFRVDAQDSKESGWYVGYRNFSSATGQEFYVVVFGSWRGDSTQSYCTLKGKSSKEDRKLIKEKIEEAQRREDVQRKRNQERTATEVQSKWDSLALDGISDYLRKKQITDCQDTGIRYEGGSIYIPMRDEDGKLWSLQKIQWDGSKFFHPGGRVRGCFHTLGQIGTPDQPIYITEGFATACSIRLATGRTVVAAFNAGNLQTVASALRRTFPSHPILVCGDDDQWKDPEKNPGREKAEAAAKSVIGKAIFPVFKNSDSKPTDFNDLHVFEGLEAVRLQIMPVQSERSFVLALGYREKEYFFTSSNNRQISGVDRFSEDAFLKLMPIEYWESAFPSAGQSRVDWSEAKSELIKQAHKRGMFQAQHVRGAGVWNDEGRVVVNMGDHLVVDGQRVELGEIPSRFFYTLGASLPALSHAPLTADECNTLVEACTRFKWTKPDYSFLMAGALVISRVCGALPVRPHVWITGGAQTGKTTLLERLISPMLGQSKMYVMAGTSEAGIRQSVKADAIPLVFDEFETTGKKSAENVHSVIELLRAAWSESGAYIIKGSAGGNAAYYQVRFSAFVSSIRVKLSNDADKSRFAVVELAPHGNDEKHWKELAAVLSEIDVEYGDRLFARTVRMLPTLLDNYKRLKKALATRVSQRFGDQYGMLLAGYSVLIQDHPLTDQEAQRLADYVKLSDESNEARVTDHDDCLGYLLTRKITLEDDLRNRCDLTIAEAIWAARTDKRIQKGLQTIGIRVELDFVAIACNFSELEIQVYRGTRWSESWDKSLLRIPGAVKGITVNGIPGKTIRIGHKSDRAVILPWTVFNA